MRALRCALLVAVAGCSFDRTGVAPPDAFVDPTDDGGGVPMIWRDDTLEDFTAAGSVLDEAVIEPWGAVGPAAHLTGALAARAADEQLFVELTGAEWPILEASAADGYATTILHGRDYGFDGPRGLSLTSFDTYTYWMWGEVWLDAGDHTWSLTADDLGFLDLAPPGGSTYQRVVTGDLDTTGIGAYNATEAGWHGLRLALTEGIADSELALRLQAPGEPAPAAIAPERLRTRVDGLPGLSWIGFEDSRLLGAVPELGPFLWRADAIDYSPSNGDITDLGFTDPDRFSMRWAGQVRIDVAGTYAFRLESDDGQRLWLDGTLLLDAWDDVPHDQTTAPIELDVGWHELVLDLTDNTGSQDVRLRATTSPDPGLVNEIPLDRLRPAPPRHERVIGAVRSGAAIPDQGEVSLDVRISAPDNATSIAVELGVTITHAFWEEVGIVVAAPDGTEYPALAVGAIDASGTRTERFTIAVPAEAARGLWAVKVEDAVALDTGTVDGVELTVRYAGGEPPIATTAIYDSRVEDLGDVVGFDSVTVTGRFPAGSSAQVRMRTCDAPDGCAAEEWSPAVASGERPAVIGRRHAQYRIELVSDGDVVPYLDAIEIGYRASSP